jgi:hypothetical protein
MQSRRLLTEWKQNILKINLGLFLSSIVFRFVSVIPNVELKFITYSKKSFATITLLWHYFLVANRMNKSVNLNT